MSFEFTHAYSGVTVDSIDLFDVLAGEKYMYILPWKYVLSNEVLSTSLSEGKAGKGSASAHIAAHGDAGWFRP